MVLYVAFVWSLFGLVVITACPGHLHLGPNSSLNKGYMISRDFGYLGLDKIGKF